MAYGNEILKRLQSIDIEAELAIAVGSNKDAVLTAIKGNLYKGFTGNNERLRPYFDADYAEMKNEMNPSAGKGNPDFYLTGQFYNNFYLDVDRQTLEVGSTDEKAAKLEQRDGNDIYKMSEEARKNVWESDIKPTLAQSISAKTGIK